MTECVVIGCGFFVDEDSDGWYEQLEQHIRWIHIPERRFGPAPIPALFALLTSGLIRTEEFAEFFRDIMERELNAAGPPTPEKVRRGVRLFKLGVVAYFVGFALLIALSWFARGAWYLRLGLLVPAEFGVLGLFWAFQRMFSLVTELPEVLTDVRMDIYPDTDE